MGQKTSGAVSFFLLVLATKLGSAQLLNAMSRWQHGPATHLWVVKASTHLASSLMKDCPQPKWVGSGQHV